MGAVYSKEMDRISDTRSPQQILVYGKKVPGGGGWGGHLGPWPHSTPIF